MGLYDNWQLANSTKTKDFAGTMAPELKEVKASAEDRYYKAQDLMLGTQEKLGTAQVLPQDQAAWEQISNEATGKINEWATRGDLENALPDLYRTASKTGVKMVALANNTKKREEIKKDLDDREKYGYLNPATKDYILGKADENFKGTTFDEYNRPVNSYGYAVKPTKQVDNIARAKRALEGLVPEGDSTITTEVGRAEAAANMLESVKTGNGWKGLSKERIQQALAAAIESDPEWKASIDQDARTSTYQNNITEEMAQKVIADPASQVGQAALKLVKENNYSAKEAVEEVNTVLHRNDTYRSLGTFADAASYFDITHSEQITDRGIPKEGTGESTPKNGEWIPTSGGATIVPGDTKTYKDYIANETAIKDRIAEADKIIKSTDGTYTERQKSLAKEDFDNAQNEYNMNKYKMTDVQNQIQVRYEDIAPTIAHKTVIKDGKKETVPASWSHVKQVNRNAQLTALNTTVTSIRKNGIRASGLMPDGDAREELLNLKPEDQNLIFNAILDNKPVSETKGVSVPDEIGPFKVNKVESDARTPAGLLWGIGKAVVNNIGGTVTLPAGNKTITISKGLYEGLKHITKKAEDPTYRKIVNKVDSMPAPSVQVSNYPLTGEKAKELRDAIGAFASTEQLLDPATIKPVDPGKVNSALADPSKVQVIGYTPELNYGRIRTPEGTFYVDLNKSNVRKEIAVHMSKADDRDLRIMSDILAPSRDFETPDHEGPNMYPTYLNKLRGNFDYIPVLDHVGNTLKNKEGNEMYLLQNPKTNTYTLYKKQADGTKVPDERGKGLSLNAAISYYHYASKQ